MDTKVPAVYYLLLICGLIVANKIVYEALLAQPAVTLSVLKTGEGIATLIREPGSGVILVDTGPDASILRGLGTELPPWKRTVDTVILTGEKASLTGGIAALGDRYRIKNRVSIGSRAVPYGTELTIGKNTAITVISPGIFSVSYGSTSLLISSTTPPKTYVLQ